MDREKFYTPHIKAVPGDFAKTVLMPGDPKRSRFVAENFLSDFRLVNDVRGVGGYTGTYKGVPVSVMASGMGMPSMGIYSYELYSFFGVENIIRIGSAGGMAEDIRLRDIIVASEAVTDSNFKEQFGLQRSHSERASESLLESAVSVSESLSIPVRPGALLSSDAFYSAGESKNAKWIEYGALGVEMEAYALYTVASHLGRRALAICTVSDHVITGESLSADERERSFTDMITLALNTAISL